MGCYQTFGPAQAHVRDRCLHAGPEEFDSEIGSLGFWSVGLVGRF